MALDRDQDLCSVPRVYPQTNATVAYSADLGHLSICTLNKNMSVFQVSCELCQHRTFAFLSVRFFSQIKDNV